MSRPVRAGSCRRDERRSTPAANRRRRERSRSTLTDHPPPRGGKARRGTTRAASCVKAQANRMPIAMGIGIAKVEGMIAEQQTWERAEVARSASEATHTPDARLIGDETNL